MGIGVGMSIFLKVLAKIFNVLAWPSFALVFPLYSSIWAVESDTPFNYQQCLTYWVLFSIITIMESALAKLLSWLPFWHYAKGIATLLLVIPHFGGASYVYVNFIRPYISVNSQVLNTFSIPRTEGLMFREQNDSLDAVERCIKENELQEAEKNTIYKVESIHTRDPVGSHLIQLASPNKVQKEWSCAVCLVSTSSEKCLEEHLRGKKHKVMEEELRINELVTDDLVRSCLMMNIGKWSSLLSPVARSITWCTWKKPYFGWTKLNTDGSIDKDNAGFGGLFRDYKGNPICAYVSKAPRDDIFLVELWAVWRGLVLALSLGIKVIWVESDSLSVVKSINREQPYRPKASSCLKHIWELLKKFEKYKVSHSWRETNRAADHLAKMYLLGSDVVLWPVDFPERLCSIIKDDAQGRRYRRG
ncbi:hypothetical protein F0562_027806 [Nyssa sinensis]|uniref:Uncharacterized protein n=1 Tax=Nyssa sinensis TaxID=561372 RepID=A0A5J5B6F0_9ASTE|nr:hypothetical protein F0562_027806 [Nyssa sinensis]